MLVPHVDSRTEGQSCRFSSDLFKPQGTSPRDWYWTLRLVLRVFLHRTEPTSTPPPGFAVSPWTDASFAQFRRDLVSVCNTYWSGRFWLRTPDTCSELDWPERGMTHRPNVRCEFELRLARDASHADLSLSCVRLNSQSDPELSRPFVNTGWNQPANGYGVGLLSDRDLQRRPDRSYGIQQIRACHEIGHALGIEHVALSGRGCTGGNEDPCYGASPHDANAGLRGQREYISGAGMLLAPSHARPWAARIRRHTETIGRPWSAGLLGHRFQIGPARRVSEIPLAPYVSSVLTALE